MDEASKTKEESPIRTRMSQLASHLGFTSVSFSVHLGKNRSYISTIGNSISSDVISRIHKEYPQISVFWLIDGEGSIEIEKNAVSNDVLSNVLTNLQSRNKELEKKVEKLIFENGKMAGQIEMLQMPTEKKVG